MMSILRILDAIVGNEPFVDFKKKKFEDGVSKLQEYLTVVRKITFCSSKIVLLKQVAFCCLSVLVNSQARSHPGERCRQSRRIR